MAKNRFLIDSNTFWMILGIFKFSIFWTRSGPLNLVFLMNLLQKYKKNQGSSWGKYYLWKYENWSFRKFRNSGNLRCPLFEFLQFRIPGFLLIRNDEFLQIIKCPFFEFLKFWIPEFLRIKNDEFLKTMKSRRRGISWD